MKNYSFIPDRESVMKRVMGDEAFLDSMLVKFSRLYADAEEKLNGYLKAGDMSECRRYVHSLKGVGLNMGINELHERSAALEKRFLDEDTEGIGEDIAAYGALIRGIIAEIQEK